MHVKQELTPEEKDQAPQTKTRKCLSCANTFESHWAGERICPQCKHSSVWRSGAMAE